MMGSFTIKIVVTSFLLRLAWPLQYDYKLLHGILKIDDYSKKYLENPILYNFWYNNTLQCVNSSVTLLQDIGDNVRINASFYKMVKNKWRTFPTNPAIDFYKNPCIALKGNILNVQQLLSGLKECPIPKGYYETHNFYIDDTKLPPHALPYGKYRATGSVYMTDAPDEHIISVQYEVEVISLKRKH